MTTRSILAAWPPYLILLVGLATACAQSPAQPKTSTSHAVPHASWTSGAESNFGISKQAFDDMGLKALTEDQFLQLLWWVGGREKQAKDAVPQISFTCGRIGEVLAESKAEAYDRVRIYVTATSRGADEVVTGLRERLRAMNGVEVVYSSDDADLVIGIVTVSTTAKNGGYQTGNAVSIVVTQPCLYKVGTYTAHYDTVQDQFIHVGSEIWPEVEAIVSSIDTNDLESQRKANAALKKYLQSMKK